ncbi:MULTISPECIES: ABC transporter permease [Paenibacillaceae]|uniref:ABC transporter permease n=2 Tax=Paenibacillaceae TaxID=186822 RepID=A0A8J4H3M8_9BACL|nr:MULTISPECIES: ABC transporter permease [Paenibacillaceae]MDT9723638.1 ABC transporter permease [Xylanibacillus composti]MUG66411.1 ABC transporter permease subunit [Paenibacillus campinasensis]PAK53059.1 ABC transporter permease [Paenibacillus sp. 7541]GIQ68319.1 ABC transporter permease [Xylanibacillus composti]
MKQTIWLVRKTLITTFKNYRNWVVYLLLPVIGIVLASLMFANSSTSALYIGIVNQDGEQSLTKDAISFVDNLDNVSTEIISESEMNERLVAGELDAVFIFPDGFASTLSSGNPQNVRIVSIQGQAVTSYVKSYFNMWIARIAAIGDVAQGEEDFRVLYEQYNESDFQLSTVQIEDQSVSNSMSKQSIGYLLILMMFSAVSLSGIMIKEKENRTYQRLLCAPVTGNMYTASNMIVNMLVMMLQIGVTLLVMMVFFQMSPGISAWLLFIVLMFFALVAVSLSLMIVALADNSMKANAWQTLIIIPTSLLAGCMFPVEVMPTYMQSIAEFLPQYWLLETIGQLQEGSMLSDVLLNLVILLAFALMFFLIAAYKFSRSRELKTFY